MSNRNDKMLDTGMSSAISRRIAEKRQEDSIKKENTNAKLRPGAQVILADIAREREMVGDIRKKKLQWNDAADLEAQINARYMHLDYLDRQEAKYKKLLRAELDNE